MRASVVGLRPLASFFFSFVVLGGVVAAQSGGHKHVAPLAPGSNLLDRILEYRQAPPGEQYDEEAITPWLTLEDALWNFGEAFPEDVGGILGPDPDPSQAPAWVRDQRANEPSGGGWQPFGTNMQNFIGKLVGDYPLAPGESSVPLGTELDTAAFEIIAPATFTGGTTPVIVVIATPATSGSNVDDNRPKDPYVYPGADTLYGLWTDDQGVRTHLGVDQYVDRFLADATVDVVGAYIMPRTAGTPLAFQLQRNRQLRHIVIDRLVNDLGVNAANIGTMMVGGSFGSLTTQMAITFHPDEFLAGVGYAFGPTQRGVLNDQDAVTFFGACAGRHFTGNGHNLHHQVNWPFFLRNRGTDYTSMSTINRVEWGDIQRPFYLLDGDEDLVSHGDLWVPVFDDNPGSERYRYFGHAQRQSQSGSTVDLYWAIIGKGCHDGDPFLSEPYIVDPTAQNPVESHDPVDAVVFMVGKAIDQMSAPAPFVPANSQLKHTNLVTLDPHDHVLNRDPYDPTDPNNAPQNVPASTEEVLREATLATGYDSPGDGTWLGAIDSLVVHGSSIYAGSTNGVVTRFAIETHTLNGQTVHPLVAQDRTHKLDAGNNKVDYSPGHGTWGLAVGDIDGQAGDELVICAYRRIAIADAVTLEIRAVAEAPFGAETEAWLYTRPRSVQIADIDNQSPGSEILFTTQYGQLVVLDGNLDLVAEHGEGGIADLLVGPTPTMRLGDQRFTKPIYCQSARGHVFSLELDSTATAPDMARLSGVSRVQFGAFTDLEEVNWPGFGPAVAALYPTHPTNKRSIRIFDPHDLDEIATFGTLANPQAPPPPGDGPPPDAVTITPFVGDTPQMAIAKDGFGKQHFVCTFANHLMVWDNSGSDSYVGLKRLDTFTPARRPTSVAAGNIDPSTTEDEVVVSTHDGHVVWFGLGELLDPVDTDLGVPRRAGVSTAGVFVDDRTNTTLSATWGLALNPTTNELHAIDQNGSWYRVDPETGAPAELLHELPDNVDPVTDLVYAGQGMSALQAGSAPATPTHTYWRVPAGAANSLREVQSQPYVKYGFKPNTWFNPSLVEPYRTGLLLDDFWICPSGGAAAVNGSTSYAAWWNFGRAATSTIRFGNLIQMVEYDATGFALSRLRNSTGAYDPANGTTHPPLPSFQSGDFGIALRTESGTPAEVFDLQTLQIGNVAAMVPGPQVVAAGLGGRVLLLGWDDATTGAGPRLRIRDNSLDYGYGGMALALHDMDGDPEMEVVFAPAYTQISSTSDYLSSRVFVLDHQGMAGALTSKHSEGTKFDELVVGGTLIGDPPGPLSPGRPFDFPGYGACGVAVADLTPGDSQPEVVVTTANGELVVFRWDPTAQTLTPVQYLKVEGALGMFNSIVVANLSQDNGSDPELYIAGSYGIRRFDVVNGAP